MLLMNTEQSLYEIDYTWLSLAQKMLLKDKSVAMFRLGLNARIAGIIGGMTDVKYLTQFPSR